MSKQRYINTKFWSDPWVVDHLNILDRHLFIYFMTNEHTNIAGVYELSIRTISNETGFEREEIARMLKRLEPKVLYIDGWVVLKNGIKNQNYHSPQAKKGIENELATCPDNLLQYIIWPNDWVLSEELQKRLKKQGSNQLGLDGIDTVSYLDLDLDKTKTEIKTKSKPNENVAKPQGFKKSETLDKKAYAKAVQADKVLAKKEQEARSRNPGSGSTKSVSELFGSK